MLHRYPQNQMEFDYFSSVPVYPQVSASFRKFPQVSFDGVWMVATKVTKTGTRGR